VSSLRLFGEFGPPAYRSYIYTPPKRRWWPLLALFGAGAVCVMAVRGLPQHRTEATPTLQIYKVPNVPPAETAAIMQDPALTRPEPAEFQVGRPLIQEDQPALKVIAEPTDIAQSPVHTRQLAAKTHSTTKKRHVARKSRRHERNDAYARYYDPGRNSYYGGYGSSYWR
jgi:hypothetical protein